tara:strand:+ start:54726 stop:55829 length:1104 start_codon:yes stop_codon:yes gene_type:complete
MSKIGIFKQAKRRDRSNSLKIRIGLIGLGDAWQTRHRPALRMLADRFDVRAVFADVPKLAENCASEFQADPVDGYRALVNRNDIDAVMVLKHSWHGWLPLLAACEAGKAVYCAGNVDFDSVRDEKVRSAVDESGVAFMMEFPRRFAPATLRLKELIATRLGSPKLIFCHTRLQNDACANAGSRGCDPMDRELIELIDWCRYVVGRDPHTVNSTGHVCSRPGSETKADTDYRSISLQFPGTPATPSESAPAESSVGDPVTVQLSCGRYISSHWKEAVAFRPPAAMQICCERGVAFIDLPSNLVWFDDAGRHLESLETELPVGERLLQHFHRAITSLVRNLSDLDDAYHASRLLAAAYDSSMHGRRIDV